MIERILTALNYIPADKVAHFAAGVVLYAMVMPFTDSATALAFACIFGLFKEVYDMAKREKHTPDVWDALATVAGGCVGYLCTLF
jgi:hypothetical protein